MVELEGRQVEEARKIKGRLSGGGGVFSFLATEKGAVCVTGRISAPSGGSPEADISHPATCYSRSRRPLLAASDTAPAAGNVIMFPDALCGMLLAF